MSQEVVAADRIQYFFVVCVPSGAPGRGPNVQPLTVLSFNALGDGLRDAVDPYNE